MKALVNTAPGKLLWKDWPKPEPGAGQVRIRVAACSICATDLEMIAGWPRTGVPAIPGHEWSGVVDAVGRGGDPALAGRRCVAENVWTDGGEVGFEHPGGYAEYLLTEARNLHFLPADFPLAVAALIEPLAVCVRALDRLRLQHRQSALIWGDGPIGLLMLALLKAENVATVCLVGGRDARLDLARQFGATATLNYHDSSNWAAAVAALPGTPFPNIIEASGSPLAMQSSLDVAPCQAKILLIGDYGGGRADFPWNTLLHHELEMIGSNASAGGWDQAVRSAATGQVPLAKLVTHTLPAAKFQEGIDLMRSRRDDVIKVVLKWE